MSDEIAIGIDLGTSNSCVAVVIDGQPMVIPNEWGESTHASVVSFLPDGSVVVGNAAKRNILLNPANTVYSAKRLIGRFYFSDEVKKAQQVMPYPIIEGPNNSVRIQVGGHAHALPEISALVLKEMKAIAEAYLGVEVSKAVVTVPAYFNDNQRQATKDAGAIAGLEVLRIINEPTAAALAYGFGQQVNQRVVIYDLGGGTFDVSILEIGDDVFEVLSTAGDTYLGGDDFDARIMDWLVAGFKQHTGIDVSGDPLILQKFKEAAEKAKITMATAQQAEIHMEEIVNGPDGQPLGFDTVLDMPTFGRMAMELIQRTFKVCDEALQGARMTAQEVDAVIMVGGPTRLPVVRTAVQHYFQAPPHTGIDPDQVVAVGAAIQANGLLSDGTEAYLLDVTPLSLRIGTVGGFTEQIIEKNTPIPIDRTRTFTTSRDGQERVVIQVFQGEEKKQEDCELLGQFEFSGFRVGYRGEVSIEVTFELDTNGIVHVTARDVETGQQASTSITLSSGLSAEEIAASQQRTADISIARIG